MFTILYVALAWDVLILRKFSAANDDLLSAPAVWPFFLKAHNGLVSKVIEYF